MVKSKYSEYVPEVYGNRFDDIITTVCEVFLVSPQEIWSYRGAKRTIWARMLLYKIFYTKLGSYSETARFFKKHPAAAYLGARKFEGYVQNLTPLRDMCIEVGEKTGLKMFRTS